MNKKGQGLPLNVIIIAAIVLIVLVVLWAIFTGRMGVFSKGLTTVTKGGDCEEAGGTVKLETAGGCSEWCTAIFGNFKNIASGQVCCRPVGSCTATAGTQTVGCGTATSENLCTSKDGCTWNPPDISKC